MKAEEVNVGDWYYIEYGYTAYKAKCVGKHNGRMVFRFKYFSIWTGSKKLLNEIDVIAPVKQEVKK